MPLLQVCLSITLALKIEFRDGFKVVQSAIPSLGKGGRGYLRFEDILW